jgi:hypothetical protein
MKDSSAEIAHKDFQQARAVRRRERIDYWRTRFAPLAVNPSPPPAPAKRRSSGIRSPIPLVQPDLPPANFETRWQSRRARASALRERMQVFSSIYNAAWLIRDSQHGCANRREDLVRQFVAVLAIELRDCRDYEALIFAVADALTASPNGLPWEG